MAADRAAPVPAASGRRLAAAGAGLATFLVLAVLALVWFQPAPPPGFAVDVVFPRGRAGLSEPLIVSGEVKAGDFFFVRYRDETTAVLGYEQWFSEAVLSAPFEVRPGERRRLELTLPALTHVRGGARNDGDEVRVVLDGREVFRATMKYGVRQASRLYFGENPIGGSSCDRRFSGTLHRPDGRPLRGGVRHAYSPGERLAGWWVDGRWQVAFVLGASLGVAALWLRRRQPATDHRSGGLERARDFLGIHRWFAISAALGVFSFFLVLTGGTGRLFQAESFGDFFDYQAVALLHGRLDVPPAAVSGEAFVVDGKSYGYFGLTPALLRLPLAAFDLGFGCWSRSFMLLAFAGALVAAYDVLLTVRRLATPGSAAPPPWLAVAFTVNLGLGSSLFFLGSRAYVYHEATLWGAAFALVSLAATLRFLATPGSRAWRLALLAGLLSLHARPPSGLFALVLLAGAGLLTAWRGRRENGPPLRRLLAPGLALPAACLLGVLSFNGASYLKFGTFDGAPLRFHVQYQPARLARIDGRNFHLANLGHNLSTYAWRTDFEVRRGFPYFYLPAQVPDHHPGAKIDLADPTLALPFAMPGLVFLAGVGLMAAPRSPPARRTVLVLIGVAFIPTAAAMLTAVAVSHRYTADFCPWLFGFAAIGLVTIEPAAGAFRRTLGVILAALTLGAMAVTFAITLHYQGAVVWGVPADVTGRYQALRKQADRFFEGANHEP